MKKEFQINDKLSLNVEIAGAKILFYIFDDISIIAYVAWRFENPQDLKSKVKEMVTQDTPSWFFREGDGGMAIRDCHDIVSFEGVILSYTIPASTMADVKQFFREQFCN